MILIMNNNININSSNYTSSNNTNNYHGLHSGLPLAMPLEERGFLGPFPNATGGKSSSSRSAQKSGTASVLGGFSLATRAGAPVGRNFQPVLNQWISRKIDDRRLRNLSKPRRELKEEQPEEPLVGRGRRKQDALRLAQMATPKPDLRKAAQEAEGRPSRKPDLAHLHALAEPQIRKLRNFGRGPMLSPKLLGLLMDDDGDD